MSMSVSDLAPLVAAALHDRVVDDLHAEKSNMSLELQSLRAYKEHLGAEGPSWIVRITGPDGTPDYASGTRRLLLSEVLEGGGYIYLILDPEGGAATCPFDAFFECRLVLTSEDGLPDKVIELNYLIR
jgi:hypothetical protein